MAMSIMNANVTLCGRHPKKLAILDGTTINAVLENELPAGKLYDIVVDATGRPEGITKAFSLTRPRGTLVVKTTTHLQRGLDLNAVVINEISVVGSRCGSFVHGLALFETGKIKVNKMIDSTFPLEEGLKAFKVAAERGAMKVMVG
jgi:threonine dehydrogenase-like Zn-dependent dehydrogenase